MTDRHTHARTHWVTVTLLHIFTVNLCWITHWKKLLFSTHSIFFFFLPPRGKELEMCVCVFVHFLLSLDIHHTDFQSNSELIWKYIEIWTYSLAYTGELLKSQPPVNHTDLTKRHDAECQTQRFPGRLLPGMEKHVWTNETKFRTSITSSKFRSLVCMSMDRWRNAVCSH